QVLATDSAGGEMMSAGAELKVDADPPIVSLRQLDRDRGVRVTVRDRASGVDSAATRIAFGDGRRSRAHDVATHLYRRAGTYTITARVRDRAGNHATVQLRVRVR
ncbi:MAG: PKD domain-containing protein, partial [Solirubrobacterales bacterium]|nr:PKD domain-containing protein [Solirubrobacterales bacterium]